MANSSSLISHVEEFVDSSRSYTIQDQSVSAITSMVKNKVLTLEALVREMELYLTTTDDLIRARGTLLLAEVLTCLVSEPLEISAISSLTGFFTSKLADWQAIHGALVGCLALLTRKNSVCMVTEHDARVLVRTFLSTVYVQTLAVKDRKLSFEVLLCLFNVYPEAAKSEGDELVYRICEAIDQEKDPRCLMLTFCLVETLVQLFPDSSGPVASSAEVLFDILGDYFPVEFTHPNENFDVKRDDLARALMQAFCATPYFEPFAIPLLLDKLSSTLPLAKLDSLKYLNNCILHYGTNRMVKHSKTIWPSLKNVIFHRLPQEPLFSSTPELVGHVESLDEQIAKEALRCLQTAILHLDDPTTDAFIVLMLEDDSIQMTFASVVHERNYSGISEEMMNQLRALGSILSIASNVSSTCCNLVFQKFFPRLIDILGVSANGLSDACVKDNKTLSKRLNFGALYLCVELLASCRDMCEASQDFSQQFTWTEDDWHYMLQNSSYLLTKVLGSALVTFDTIETNENVDRGCFFYAVKGLLVLGTFPGCHLRIAKDFFEDVLTILMLAIINRSDDTILWNAALNALIKIGSFIEKQQDAQREISYNNIVVERIISLLPVDDSNISLTLKLEAISKIGISGLSYMPRVMRGLEETIFSNFSNACVEGDTKSAELLVPLLECYSSQVLPWCHTSGNFEGVKKFAVNIWSLIENTPTFNMCSGTQVILDSAMMMMKRAVGGCTEEYQLLILEKAYTVLSSTNFFSELILPGSSKLEGFQFLPDAGDLSYRNQWIVSMFSSIVVALRPHTPLPDPRILVTLFLVILLKGHVSAAHALASMINKWSVKITNTEVSSAFTLEEAIEVIFNRSLSSVLRCSAVRDCNILNNEENWGPTYPVSVQIHAAVGLAWVGKGLLMRGHEKVKEIALLLLKCLLFQDELGNGDHVHSPDKRTVADGFHILLGDSELCLNKEFHAIIRPLYKQRFSSIMIPILISLTKDSESSRSRSVLYRPFGHVISDTPLAAVVTEARKLIPSLLDALSVLCLDTVNTDLVYSILLVLAGILMDENGKEAIIENTHTVISHLTRLVSYPDKMLVRETAIQCLVAMSGLPHTKIYPMRPQVLGAVSKALDDPKRVVRQEAVKCRQAWASIASRSLHF